jgi:hypothetical protein
MKHFIVASLFAAGLFAADSGARVPVLAELFTSEGCSSCPPADALLMKLDQQLIAGAQVIVLSEHVDYWNSLGWSDPFSSAQFSQRQDQYARSLHAETFTPQLVIDGKTQCNGGDGKAIQAAIESAASHPKSPVRIVTAKREGKEAVVEFSIGPLASGKSDVWVALADERDQSSVRKGENNGKTLTHVAVVRSLGKAGKVSKAAGLDKTVRIPLTSQMENMRVVVFVAESNGPVMGVAMEKLGG